MQTKIKHFLVNLLMVLLVLEPFSFAAAGGIVVAPGAPASKQPTLDAAPNGVPVVTIVKPNASGLSHNQFDQFNVSPKGVILNNSSRPGVSQLGGAISGNANFGGGPEARLILNEVTGSSRSNIEGYTEIFGAAAQYILANPNGVSVNGGGFINTPTAALTTGVPRFDASGGLLGLDVRRGDVLIEGQGINADNLDAFAIVTRAVKINAEIHAKKLSLIAGQGSFDPATGQTTALAPALPDGSAAPAVAIDSTALGGMYAERIQFVGTEAGVGVSLAGPVRATDRLTLTADGKIRIVGAVSADKDASVTSSGGSVEIAGQLAAGGAANVTAAQELRLASQAGGDAPLLYGATVNVVAGRLTNVDGKLVANSALSATTTGDMSNSGVIAAGTGATLTAGGALTNSGQIQATGALTAAGQGGLTNSGTLQSGEELTARSASGTLSNSGQILAQGALTAAGQGGVENSGTLQAGTELTARSDSGFTNTGTVSAQGGLSIDVSGALDNSGALNAAGSGAFQAGSLTNRAGGQIKALQDVLFGVDAELRNAGTINAGGQATLRSSGSLRNETSGQVSAQTGILLASLTDFENLGTFNSGGTGSYSAAGQLKNSGTLSSSGSATFVAANLTNDATGQILSQGDGQLTLSGDFTNAGLVYSGGKGTYRVGGTLLNNRGQLLSQGDMLLEGLASGGRMAALRNDSGSIESLGGGIGIKAANVLNNNLDFTLEEGAIAGTTLEGGLHSYGNDAWGVASIFSWATGHGTTGAFTWNAKRIYPTYVAALGLAATRNVFSLAELTAAVDKAEQELLTTPDAARQANVNWVKSNIIAANAPYAVLIPGGRGEIVVYEAMTSTDKATGLDKGGSIAASTSVAVEADQFTNSVSKISTAAGDISINAATFENTGKDLYERSTVNWGRGFTNNSKHTGVYSEGTGQEVVLTPVGHAYGTINAGGKVAITATHVNNGITENSGTSGTGSAPALKAPAKPGSLGQSLPSMTDVIGTLPKSGLFSVNTTPGHHYLVETNPALTNMSTFYGSDYFLSRAGIDLDKTNMQLLGDAFYETRLVREQIFALTGKRLLSTSATSDAEQMQALMDSALRAKTSLDLTVGVALSQEQIANLTEDIVWLEKTVVDGHEVLAPKVYLASKSLANIAQGGSVIVGKDVAITTTGDTKNSGVLLAENTLTVNAANLFNTSGTIKGQTVAVSATDALTNTSGTISGTDVTLSAGKNITVDTTTTTFASSDTTSVVAGQRGSVAASGTLKMTAGENLSVTGADVSAGGDASLSAGKTVAIAAQSVSNTTNIAGALYRSKSDIEANQAASVSTGGALSVTAGQDALITGSKVQAGTDASITAGRNVTIASATDKQSSSSFIEGKSGGLFGGKSSESHSDSSTTNVAAQVSAGGKLTAEAGAAGSGDLVVAGSKVSAIKDVSLESGGNIQIAATQMTSSSHSESKSSGAMGLLSDSATKDNQKVTTVRSEVEAGTDIAVEAKQNITLTAAKITSGGETKLTSDEGQVSILTSKDSEYNQKVSSNVGLLTWSSQDKGKSTETIVNSLFQTGKGLTITSKNGVTVEYKQTGNLRQDIQQLSQAQGLEWMGELLKRDDVNWQAVQEKYASWNKKSGGISPAATIIASIIVAAVTAGAAAEFALLITGLEVGKDGALVVAATGVAANAVQVATYSALQAGIVAVAAKTTTGVADAAAGGDLGKNMGAMLTEDGVRSLLSTMVLAGAMGTMGSSFAKYGKPGEILATTAVKTITSSLVGGEELQKAFLTSLGSSFDCYAKGMISAAELDDSVALILKGAAGAAGAALVGGDPVQGAISSIVSQLAESVKVAPLTEEQKKEVQTFAPLSQCAYGEVCTPPPGCRLLTQDDIKDAGVDLSALFDTSKGLQVDVYLMSGVDGAKDSVILSARGSDELKDWTGTNLPQIVGNVGDQYRQIMAPNTLAELEKLALVYSANLDATGHSLAGGLGTALASTGIFTKVVTFNAVVVNPATYAATSGAKGAVDTVVTNYVTRADPLTFLQNIIFSSWMTKDQVMLESGFHGIDSTVEKYTSK